MGFQAPRYPDEDTNLLRKNDSKRYANDNRRRVSSPRPAIFSAIGSSMISIVLSIVVLSGTLVGSWRKLATSPGKKAHSGTGLQFLDEAGRFIVEDYDCKPPFSSFLPSLVGDFGMPMFVNYVNRGQGVSSFGDGSRKIPIMPPSSASNAYQNTPLVGFRTVIQGKRNNGVEFRAEPFSPLTARFGVKDHIKTFPKRIMYVGMNEMQLQDTDAGNGMETNVTFFALPMERFGALVKQTTIRNISPLSVSISVIDGLANIWPGSDLNINEVLKIPDESLHGRMRVLFPKEDSSRMPFFTIIDDVGVESSASKSGHWCMSILGSENAEPVLLPIVYDAEIIFGRDSSLQQFAGLYNDTFEAITRKRQFDLKHPSAFGALEKVSLKPGSVVTMTTYYGRAKGLNELPAIAQTLLQTSFSTQKRGIAKKITDEITSVVQTSTSMPIFDGHIRQAFLDNSLQHGFPQMLGETDDDARMRNTDEDPRLKVLHLFSRETGSLERTKREFYTGIEPTYSYSAMSRLEDVLRSRRSEVLFLPRMGAYNVKTLVSFIQADGSVPALAFASAFRIEDKSTAESIATVSMGRADGKRAQRELLASMLHRRPFQIGQLWSQMDEQNIRLITSRSEFVDLVAAASKMSLLVKPEISTSGDSWMSYIDHVRSFVAIYPDWEERIMFDEHLPYFFSTTSSLVNCSFPVSPSTKILNKRRRCEDPTKIEFASHFYNHTGTASNVQEFAARWQLSDSFVAYKSSVVTKLFLLGTLQFSFRDPFGLGVVSDEQINLRDGAQHFFSSFMTGSHGLVQLLGYLKSLMGRFEHDVVVPCEFADLVDDICNAIQDFQSRAVLGNVTLGSTIPGHFIDYWNRVNAARDNYRSKTNLRFKGDTATMSAVQVGEILGLWLNETSNGIYRAAAFGFNSGGRSKIDENLAPSRFKYTVREWKWRGKSHSKRRRPHKVEIELGTLLLEGQVARLRTESSGGASALYQNTRQSALRDQTLNMYKVSTDEDATYGIHLDLSYEFYLEMLRHRLYSDFFSEMKGGGMLPFFDYSKYGRSLMECSEFVAASNRPDPSFRGRGFFPRFTAATADILDIWATMFFGRNPFFIDRETGSFGMQLSPTIPHWFFTLQGVTDPFPVISFKLFGSINVTYIHKRGQADLFEATPSRYVIGLRDGSFHEVRKPTLPNSLADKVRRVLLVNTIEVYFE